MTDTSASKPRIVRLDPAWPVEPGPRFRGLVWNHPTLKDGTLITTSQVMEFHGGRIVTRSGSIYLLGRTYVSERHAAQRAGVDLKEETATSTQRLNVIDLESDDLSALDTHPLSRTPETGH
jgi:hypothetical protein